MWTNINMLLATIVILGQAEEAKLLRRLGFDIKETRELATCKCLTPNAGNVGNNRIECNNGEDFACQKNQACVSGDPFLMPLNDDKEPEGWLQDPSLEEACPTTDEKFVLECFDGRQCDARFDPFGWECCFNYGGIKKCPLGTTMCENPIRKEGMVMMNWEKSEIWTCAGPGQGLQFETCDLVGGPKKTCHNYVCPTTSDPNIMECMDGFICNVNYPVAGENWGCCEGHGGRARCPKKHVMCADKGSCSGDHCCKKTIEECSQRGGLRLDCPSYRDPENPFSGTNPDSAVCKFFDYTNVGEQILNIVGADNLHKNEEALDALKAMNYAPLCPTKDEVLATPLKGKTGKDRKARWHCPSCDCGCFIPYGASRDETDPSWVPGCVQSKGNWRFPYPHLWNDMQPASMLEHLSNFVNDAGKEEEWEYTATSNAFVSGFWTKREYKHWDRVFKFHEKSFDSYLPKGAAHAEVYTTEWCNTEESGNDGTSMDCKCRPGFAIVGFKSKFSAQTKDRRWKLECGKIPGTRILNLRNEDYRHTGAVNTFGNNSPSLLRTEETNDVTGNKVCLHDEVVCGLYGHHINVPHDDRSYGIFCCRIQIATQQCTIVQVDITKQVITQMSKSSNSYADKITVNNCGNPMKVKNTVTASHGIETQTASTFELSKSFEQTFSIGMSAEYSMGFEATHSTPGKEQIGGAETKFSSSFSIGMSSEYSQTASKSQTTIQYSHKTKTETFAKGFEYETPSNTHLFLTSTGKEYKGEIYWTGIAKCMYDAGGVLVTLERKPVSGSWKGAKVMDVVRDFDVRTCEADGFKMEYERYCEAGDRLTDDLTGDYLTFDTLAKAKEACEKNDECGAVFDEGCTNDGSLPIMLCHAKAFLEFSKHSCVLVETAPVRAAAPKCPASYQGDCKDTGNCGEELKNCSPGICCSVGWKADCDMDCAKENCLEAGGSWIEEGDRGLNRAVHHYVCEMGPKNDREECHCDAPGVSKKIKCSDGTESTCASDEYCSNAMAIHRTMVQFESLDCYQANDPVACRAKKQICAPIESAIAKALRHA